MAKTKTSMILIIMTAMIRQKNRRELHITDILQEKSGTIVIIRMYRWCNG